MSYVEYNPTNSGGDWWLKDEDWRALEEAGWIVHWANLEKLYTDGGDYVYAENGVPKLVPSGESNSRFTSFVRPDADGNYRYLGALARYAYKPNCDSLRKAVDEWEAVTSGCSTDAGCPCCGNPHNFTLYSDKGECLESGPETHYGASW